MSPTKKQLHTMVDSPGALSINDIFDSQGEAVSRKRTLKNLLTLSFAYFLVYTGFWTLSTLQSTMNAEGGIGDASQTVIYVFSMFSSILLTDLSIGRFGCKSIMVMGTVACCAYMASNMYLRWDTMMITSALYGFSNGPFMSALTVYVDEMATRFQSTVSENTEVVMACFFGIYIFFSEFTNVVGNIISYEVLSIGKGNDTNYTETQRCGLHFIPSDDKNHSNANLIPPPEAQRLLLGGIYVALGLLAVVIMFFMLEPLKNDIKETHGCKTVTHRLMSAILLLKKPQQLLLLPITIYMGMEGPFYSNEITQAYIACSWGVHHVGFVTICFGVCGAIMALAVGPLVKCISQLAVLVLAAGANLACCILLFFWQPSPDAPYAYFLFAGVWGMGDAIWWSQLAALYGLMFPNDREAAFSNLYFWSFLGFFLSYSYANYLTVAAKLNILLVFLITGIVGFLIGQFKIKCSPRNEYIVLDQEES